MNDESVRSLQDHWQALGFTAALCCVVLIGAVLVVAAVRTAGRSRGPSLLVLLLVLLLASMVVLSVGQSEVALGLEIAVLGLGLGIVTGVRAATDSGTEPLWRSLSAMLPAAGLVVGGILLETDTTSGYLWTFAAIALGLALAVERSWAMTTADQG
jgi:hypothetical protein